ncbi:MAG: hypothetical protein PWQ91_1232 [Eubacteriales bacterium]|nr:hypothetical protein [Eubacteriales bacterium]MDN5364171.1 hypothetical protein [Eubacteriales bacterium]
MKICPRCLAEYSDEETKEYSRCIECYGDNVEVELMDKKHFLNIFAVHDLERKIDEVKRSACSEQTKAIILRRIEKLIQEKTAGSAKSLI